MSANGAKNAQGAMTKPKRRRSQKYSAAPLVGEIDEGSLGPAMRALTPKQRRFVLELQRGPAGYGSAVRDIRAAGYGTPTSSSTAMRVEANRVLHNPKVQDALREVGGKIIRAEAFEAIQTTAAIARNPKHKDCLKANLALMDRGGFAPETTHHVEVAHSHKHAIEATPAVLERIRQLALAAGLNPQALPPTIDVTSEEITEGEHG
jgi:phage terminase small subunit